MSEREAVLFANEAFYRAFAGRDMAAMEALWARRHAVSCLHPGWPPLQGREDVLRSWRGILQADAEIDIVCQDSSVTCQGDIAMVLCYERLGGSYLIATNVFVREDRYWRMLHHHSGPTAGRPAETEDVPSVTFN